jgi:hypothetical protein
VSISFLCNFKYFIVNKGAPLMVFLHELKE